MMDFGTNLFNARKKAGLSQEEVAISLNISRQTISKWELNETIPDIYQVQKLARLYAVTIDELISFDSDILEIEKIIINTDDKLTEKINWTNSWSKKYPVLKNYQETLDVQIYADKLREMLNSIKNEYHYNDLDSMLILKDILYHEWKDKKLK